MAFLVPERWRTDGPRGENCGAFLIKRRRGGRLRCIASDGDGWEHVSVSIPGFKRLPTWEEMAFVKRQFWGAEDAVMQLHPRESEYVDNFEVLHLWRPVPGALPPIPTPPPILVGVPKGARP